jgi:hypothetical protein
LARANAEGMGKKLKWSFALRFSANSNFSETVVDDVLRQYLLVDNDIDYALKVSIPDEDG